MANLIIWIMVKKTRSKFVRHRSSSLCYLAVYLCKRTMQNKTRLELADYEAENLARLQKLLARKWEFIYMQAEAQIK